MTGKLSLYSIDDMEQAQQVAAAIKEAKVDSTRLVTLLPLISYFLDENGSGRGKKRSSPSRSLGREIRRHRSPSPRLSRREAERHRFPSPRLPRKETPQHQSTSPPSWRGETPQPRSPSPGLSRRETQQSRVSPRPPSPSSSEDELFPEPTMSDR